MTTSISTRILGMKKCLGRSSAKVWGQLLSYAFDVDLGPVEEWSPLELQMKTSQKPIVISKLLCHSPSNSARFVQQTS
ncbi:hypothetical protein TIFTF001_011960 [Ficus carica]|uniref:Uncharacterized protein n=1 Tax=Ficus carica TaxID=3494 RepID=A0AA88ABF7_FICCA|nr:hypothetical protein TIFTF001_011960 [Ficus carica]